MIQENEVNDPEAQDTSDPEVSEFSSANISVSVLNNINEKCIELGLGTLSITNKRVLWES